MSWVQVAALAEFRADWATAVKTYQAAYLELLRIPLSNPFTQNSFANIHLGLPCRQ